jgi:hypothetical protein
MDTWMERRMDVELDRYVGESVDGWMHGKLADWMDH